MLVVSGFQVTRKDESSRKSGRPHNYLTNVYHAVYNAVTTFGHWQIYVQVQQLRLSCSQTIVWDYVCEVVNLCWIDNIPT